MQETNSDAVIHKSRPLVSSVYRLYLGYSDALSISVVEMVLRHAMLRHARMQSNMTHWLAYIGIIGNLHDVNLKAFSDIPDTVVNSSAVVGLDKFIPSFAVSDVSLF